MGLCDRSWHWMLAVSADSSDFWPRFRIVNSRVDEWRGRVVITMWRKYQFRVNKGGNILRSVNGLTLTLVPGSHQAELIELIGFCVSWAQKGLMVDDEWASSFLSSILLIGTSSTFSSSKLSHHYQLIVTSSWPNHRDSNSIYRLITSPLSINLHQLTISIDHLLISASLLSHYRDTRPCSSYLPSPA